MTPGSISLSSRTVADGRAHVPPEQRDLSMVFQDYALWPHLTALDNVAFALRRRHPRDRRRQRRRQRRRRAAAGDAAGRGGRVADVAFRGRGYEYAIDLPGLGRLTGVFGRHRANRGDEVAMRLDPEGCHLFPADASHQFGLFF